MNYVWIVAGLALLGAELLTPGGFYLIFFGVGALITGLVVNLLPDLPSWVQVGLFSAVSIAALLGLRKPILRYFESRNSAQPVDRMVGEVAVAVESIAPQGRGRAEYRGSSWQVHNIGAQALASGERCRIVRTDGLTLIVTSEVEN